jgi:hypothetical protein
MTKHPSDEREGRRALVHEQSWPSCNYGQESATNPIEHLLDPVEPKVSRQLYQRRAGGGSRNRHYSIFLLLGSRRAPSNSSKKVGDCELAGSRRATSAVSKWTSGVFEQTCVALRIGCDDDVKQAIAKKIIELAPGERSPDQLCERALEDIRQPLQAAYRA